MMLVALGIFVVFSLACALSRSITQLIVFRAFAGAGGGAIMSLSMQVPYLPYQLALADSRAGSSSLMASLHCHARHSPADISTVVSLKQRGKYQGIVGAVIAVGNGIGPLIGSVFSQHATWRWCFWINVSTDRARRIRLPD